MNENAGAFTGFCVFHFGQIFPEVTLHQEHYEQRYIER